MTSTSGYLGAIAANGPVSLMVPSTITTAPAGITPDAPRRGSVIAYAPRMMIVSVITLHPSQFGTLRAADVIGALAGLSPEAIPMQRLSVKMRGRTAGSNASSPLRGD